MAAQEMLRDDGAVRHCVRECWVYFRREFVSPDHLFFSSGHLTAISKHGKRGASTDRKNRVIEPHNVLKIHVSTVRFVPARAAVSFELRDVVCFSRLPHLLVNTRVLTSVLRPSVFHLAST